MSKEIHKSHNVSILLYHFVCPAKYRRAIFDNTVDNSLKEICLAISDRYGIEFVEIGTDKDHVHFLLQSIPKYSPSQIVKLIKSLTAKQLFLKHPEIKKQLWGGELWTDGYYVSTVGTHGNEETISNYVKNQGKEKEYKKLHRQNVLFDMYD